ncbi:unnamed protein product [Lampetra planeri]
MVATTKNLALLNLSTCRRRLVSITSLHSPPLASSSPAGASYKKIAYLRHIASFGRPLCLSSLLSLCTEARCRTLCAARLSLYTEDQDRQCKAPFLYLERYPFKIGEETIPTVEEKPVKSLEKWYRAELNDKERVK